MWTDPLVLPDLNTTWAEYMANAEQVMMQCNADRLSVELWSSE